MLRGGLAQFVISSSSFIETTNVAFLFLSCCFFGNPDESYRLPQPQRITNEVNCVETTRGRHNNQEGSFPLVRLWVSSLDGARHFLNSNILVWVDRALALAPSSCTALRGRNICIHLRAPRRDDKALFRDRTRRERESCWPPQPTTYNKARA